MLVKEGDSTNPYINVCSIILNPLQSPSHCPRPPQPPIKGQWKHSAPE